MRSDFDGIYSGISYGVKKTRFDFSSVGNFNKECALYSDKEYLLGIGNCNIFYKRDSETAWNSKKYYFG
jgi:hypothetical protein